MPPRALELTDRCAVQADDAQARKVKICHDRRIHCAQKLQFPGTDRFLQNPDGALVAWNDGPGFSDEDFKSIQNIGNSEKKSQAGKTGRFGVGFRAVYHITDLPSLVSANRVVFFDPQRRFLGKGPDGRRKGADIDFVNKPKGVQKYADQYEPYKMFGCDMVERFAGTLLRLPLRSKSEADSEHQELKKEACSADMVLALFDEFKQTAGSMLLFLQHVEEIELLVWEPGAPEPDLVFSTRIASSLDAEELEAMRAARSSMSAAGEAPGAACDDDEERGEVTCPVFTLAIETSDHSLDDEGSVQSVRWLVSQSAAEPGSEAELLAADSVQDELGMRLVSWGGVAAVVSGEAHDEDGGLQDLLQGRAYCTLPLPQFTGFPVHMNGFFELGENRCDICFGDDTIGEGKKKTDWNVALLRDCVVPAYARLIVHATEHEFKGADNRMDMLSRLFPTGSFEDKSKPWTAVPKELYARLCMQPVLLSTSGWLVCPSKALMADSESAGSMVDILSRSKRDIVDVSAARKLHEMFKRYVPEQITDVSPSCVRDMIREGEIDVQEATVLPVLEYCIRDCIRDQEWGHLVGLRLLPLPASAEAGRLDSFACSGSDEFHLCTPQELAMLTVSPARFVDPAIHGYPDLDDPDLDGVIYHALQSEAALSALNVRVFSSGDMIEMLNSEPGELYMGLEGVRLRRNLHPNECYERLHRTWDWILLNDCLKDAACLCVVPGTITGTEVLCSLDQAHLIDPDMFSKTPGMIDCLGMMGCASVDFGFFSSVFRDRAAATTALDSFLIHDEPTALLSCIHRWSKRGRYLDNPTTPEKHRKTLRDIVCRQDVVHAIGQHDEDDEDEDDVLRSLSLFRRHGADDSDYYSLDDGYLPPADVDRVLFPFVSEVLDLDTAALRLADALHAERMSVQKFFEKLVEKMGDVFSTKEELYSAALKFLVETATRSEVDCSLFDLLITQAIVPAGRGRGLVRVDSLYDIDSDSPFSRAKMHLPEHFPSWAFDASAGNSKTSMRLIHQLKMLRRHAQQRDPNSTVFQKVLTQTHALYVLDRILKQQDEDDFDLARDCIIQCVEFAIHSSEKIVHLPILVQRGSETKMCRADGDEPVFLNDTSFPCNNPNLWQVDERISKHFSANASRLMKVCSSETAGLQALSRDPTKLLSNVRSDQFGVSVNLVATIDSVLKKYQSCTIFKELLQNADDAGAEFVHFIHDHRESPFATDSLVHKDLADFMGPSLYAFNSAEFTEGNYEAICKIFESNKEADQTGQFGVGFTSAYHITDLPGFLTGDSLCIMDPLRVIFDQNGMRFPLSSTYEQCSSDFAPFCDMREFFRDDMHDPQNCEEKDKPFAGTMFRFPLRKTKGKIPSAKAMPNKEMDALMRQELVDSTDDIILFLKSVKRIRVSVIEAGALSPRKIFELRTIPVAVPVLPHVSRKRVEATRGDGHASACDWIISSTDEKLPVSVALNLSSDVSKDGRFYCLLPMPMISNLPVHVNAPFALDDSRSNMFMGSDSRDKRLKQNARIMQLSLPVAYLNLLDAVKTEVEVLSLFPCGLEGMLRTDFLPALYGHMTRSNAPALFPTTAAGDPHHIVYERAVFRDGSLDVACADSLEAAGMSLISIPEAVRCCLEQYAKKMRMITPGEVAMFLQALPEVKSSCVVHRAVTAGPLSQSLAEIEVQLSLCMYLNGCTLEQLDGIPLLPLCNDSYTVNGALAVVGNQVQDQTRVVQHNPKEDLLLRHCGGGINKLLLHHRLHNKLNFATFHIKRFDADVLIEHPPPPAFFGQESTPGFATLPRVEAVTTEDKGRRAWYLALWEWLEGEGGVLPDLPFPMLPTKQTGDGLVRVYRLSDRSKLLQPSGSRGDAEQAVEKILVACGCPVLDPARLSMVREVGQPFEYRAVLVALREQFRSAEAFKLSAEMSKKLLTFVANEVGRSAIPVEAAAILRELRLHESVWADPAAPDRGLLVSLESVSGRDVWILEEEPAALDAVRTAMGKLGAENASRQKFEASFLRCPAWDSNLRSLYVQLGVKPISLCEFCKRFAFVDEEDRLVYLHMLADQPQLLKLNGLSELVHELSFIPSTDGFAVASKCFDERCDFYLRFASRLMGGSAVTTVGLFMDLEEQGLLVDGARGRWVVFLNANGRKHDQATISYDDYASCMRIIAEHGRVQSIAFELVADVFAKIGRDSASKPDKKLKSATAKSGRWFCMKMEQCGLAKIECIPAISSSLASAVPALETDACDELHCLANLVHWQDSSVCWTVRPSLPNDAFDLHPSALDAIRTVGGLETPSVKDVIEHLENVGNHFAESRSSLDPQDPHNPHSLAVTDIYVWLSRELDQPTDDQTAALHDLRERAPPLVLLESGEFVASRVVFFGLAKSGATAQAAMQATAMQATACPPHFCDFPECWIEQAAMFKLMGVCKAPNAEDLLFTIRSIQERRKVDPLDPNEIEASRISLTSLLQDDTWSEDGPVYFLDDTFRLRPVSEICVQDDPRWASRVSGTVHFIDTDLLHVIASNSRAFGRATDLGLQFLSRLVDERLVPPAPAHYLPAGSKAEAEEVLGSDAFKRALLRIHAHERPWHSGDVEKRVLQKIEAIRHCSLVPVSTIMTRIVAKDTGEELSQPTGADHSQDERDTHRKVFGDLENQRILVVPSAEGFGTALAREVNRLLDGLVTNELFLQIAVGTYPPERITAALGECGVPESTDGYGAFGLGLPLLDHHHACLSQDIGEHFSAGEFVAYLRQEDLRQEAFVYARVVTHAVGTGRLDARLELTVNQSGATEQVSSLYVYKFDGDTSRAIHEEMAIVAVGEVQDAPAETDLDGRPCDDDETENLTLREKLLEVCELLREALSLGDREKKQVLRRLYLRWHPDKNPDDKADCTEVFKYLKACIDADRILPLPGEAQPPGNGFGAPPSDGGGGFAGAGGGFGGGGFGGAGGGFGEQYNEWESYARRAGQAHGRHEQRSPPDPAASRRWAEQAVSDTHAARVLLQSECWSQCCFYSHQALEVALKAALFRTPSHTSNMLTHHRITEFAQLLHDAELGAPDVRAEAGELQQYYIASRYPNARENHGSSPSARLGRDQATDAFSATQGAVQRLQAFL